MFMVNDVVLDDILLLGAGWWQTRHGSTQPFSRYKGRAEQ